MEGNGVGKQDTQISSISLALQDSCILAEEPAANVTQKTAEQGNFTSVSTVRADGVFNLYFLEFCKTSIIFHSSGFIWGKNSSFKFLNISGKDKQLYYFEINNNKMLLLLISAFPPSLKQY